MNSRKNVWHDDSTSLSTPQVSGSSSRNTHGADLFIIDKGRATATQRERGLLRMLRDGDFFGEIALLGKGKRTATITAETPMVVWVLRGQAIRTLQADHPEVTKALVTAMGDRLATDW